MNTIINTCNERNDIFIIAGDAGLGVFDEFKDKYSDQFLNLGVAEQNTISFSAGLSLSGFKVYVYNIIPFVLYRCYEQVRNDICYQKLPVSLVGIGSGITYAPQGMTHYSVEDIGLARTLPNLTVISPIDPVEAKLAAEYTLKSECPTYTRLAKRGEPVIHKKEIFDISIPQVIEQGEDVAILFHGSISTEVMQAYEKLKQEGYAPMIVSVPMLQPLNFEALLEILNDVKHVVSVEEHYADCGLGGILKALYSELHPSWTLKTLGIAYQFIHTIKDTINMRKHFGISSNNIIEAVKEMTGV